MHFCSSAVLKCLEIFKSQVHKILFKYWVIFFMHTEHVNLWLDDSNVVQYVASCHVFSVCYIFLILEQERWVNVGLEVLRVTGLYPSCRQFSWAAMATTWWQVETTVWWRCGRLVTSNSSTSIQAVMQASEPWTYHMIKGQGKQLYAGDGILGPWD